MGGAKYYMGCMITRNRKALELKLDQHLYVKSVMETFGVQKASRIPASLGKVTQVINEEKQKEQVVCKKQLHIGENNHVSPNINPRVNNTNHHVLLFIN